MVWSAGNNVATGFAVEGWLRRADHATAGISGWRLILYIIYPHLFKDRVTRYLTNLGVGDHQGMVFERCVYLLFTL